MKYLEQVAAYICEREIPLKHLTIVLPSERAGKYLAAALSSAYGKPILAPDITTMDRWVRSYSPLTVIDKTRALLRLFEIQLEDARSEEDRSFEAFMSWGTMLLSDFDEIDRYLIDPDQIFRNLKEIREIEQWSFGEEELTESQKRFLEFWERLPRYYKTLNERLKKQGKCYAGSAYRFLAQHPNVLFQEDEKRQFLFAGFNALSGAEISIVRQLENLGRAHILIDADKWYLSNPQHEAGRFLRDMSKALDGKRFDFVVDRLATKALELNVIECAQRTGQAKAAASLLAELQPDQLKDTVLLLADESLIDAVIRNLPKSLGKANISLGLPIRNTVIRTWVDLLFTVQENKRRFKTSAVYFSDLQLFWNHPLLLAVLSSEEQIQVGKEERRIIAQNRIFLKAENLSIGENSKDLLQDVLVDWGSDYLLGLRQMRKLNRSIYSRLTETFAFEKAALEGFDRAALEFENMAMEGLPEMSLRSFRQLFQQHWSNRSIAYHGNPTDGLQIMGLLETRALDFKRIICVGMNEGNLPPTNPMQTVIPMDLRKAYGLPNPREKQGLFAHHFYRLLHQCERMDACIYTADEVIGNNEVSRYLLQLEMELARQNPNIEWTRKVYMLQEQGGTFEKSIPKTPEILDRLDELFAQSASASMWKKYLTCPLDFYFRYVMDFGEEEGVEEEVEHNTFGTFIHNTLEILYAPFARFTKDGEAKSPAPPPIRTADVERMQKDFLVVLKQQFLEHFHGDEEAFMKGKNLLSYQMAIELTGRFLRSEVDFLAAQTEDVFIEALERAYESSISVDLSSGTKEVKLRGFIDRIDRIGNKVRIIDYKSGKVNKLDVALRKKDLEIEEVVESLSKSKHVLQLIQYAWLYRQAHGEYPESSIISFISGGNEPFTLDTASLDYREVIDNFPTYIGRILEDIYDLDLPFEHTEQQFSYCNYCQ